MKSIKRWSKTEKFRFFLGATLGVYFASSAFEISLAHLTLGSFVGLFFCALWFGAIFMDEAAKKHKKITSKN